MFHSMVFFWHRYELPAMAYGIVTIDRPRFTAMNTTTATTTPRGRVPHSLQTTHTNDVTQTEIPSLSFHSPNQADTTSSSQDFGLSMRPTQQPQEQESMMIGRNHPSFLSISSDLIRTFFVRPLSALRSCKPKNKCWGLLKNCHGESTSDCPWEI